MGFGSLPQCSFTISYIWENNKYRTVEALFFFVNFIFEALISEVNKNYHYALAHGFTALGPAVGMLFSGKITTIWVDYLDKGLEAPDSIDYSSKLGF